MGLRNQGASKGATTSFMISTPQTGIDSILVVGFFLGWPFAAFKVLAAFVTGVIGGTLVNRFGGYDAPAAGEGEQGEHWRSTDNRAVAVLRYAVFDILAAIDLWLIVGILLAAAITASVPPDFLQGMAWTQGIGGMFLVLIFALPLYVCTTSSVPIAASLIAAGMPVGSALVFLMAGPATNVATVGAVYRTLGLRVLLIYLGTVIVSSIGFGMTFDFIISQDQAAVDVHEHSERAWWESASALLLIGLMLYLLWRRALDRMRRGARFSEEDRHSAVVIQVDGMTCQHCVANVRQALESQERVDKVAIDLSSGRVQVRGAQLRRADLVSAVTNAGYRVGSEDED
jgi:copper chaperone CopZ